MNDALQLILENIAVPIIGAIGTALVIIVKQLGDRIVKSVIDKNSADEIEKAFKIQNLLMEKLDMIVKSAVASNMQIADDIKCSGKGISEQQAEVLRNSARDIIMKSLPTGITVGDNKQNVIDILGGEQRVNIMIDSLMEKYVYEYKLQKEAAEDNSCG